MALKIQHEQQAHAQANLCDDECRVYIIGHSEAETKPECVILNICYFCRQACEAFPMHCQCI